MFDKRVTYFNQFLLAFSDPKATAETDEAGEGAGKRRSHKRSSKMSLVRSWKVL